MCTSSLINIQHEIHSSVPLVIYSLCVYFLTKISSTSTLCCAGDGEDRDIYKIYPRLIFQQVNQKIKQLIIPKSVISKPSTTGQREGHSNKFPGECDSKFDTSMMSRSQANKRGQSVSCSSLRSVDKNFAFRTWLIFNFLIYLHNF